MARKQVLVQLDDRLVVELDATARRMGVSRSELIRRASLSFLDALKEEELDRRHAEGYRRFPQDLDVVEHFEVAEPPGRYGK